MDERTPRLRDVVWACMVYGLYGLYGCMAIPKRETRRAGCMGRKSRFADFDLDTTMAVAPSKHHMFSFILSEVKRVSLKASLLSGVESTPTASSLLVIVPLLSSAASIPLPFEIIFKAILFNSDILI